MKNCEGCGAPPEPRGCSYCGRAAPVEAECSMVPVRGSRAVAANLNNAFSSVYSTPFGDLYGQQAMNRYAQDMMRAAQQAPPRHGLAGGLFGGALGGFRL